MKKVIIFFILALFLFGYQQKQETKITTKPMTIKTAEKEIKVNAEIADSPEEWQKGLMYREYLADDSGMLFVFNDSNYRSFWMKNTLIPLDMIFVSANGTIVDINEDFQPCKTDFCDSYKSKGKARYVLEVNGGFAEGNNISIGDLAII